jgi:protein TonB
MPMNDDDERDDKTTPFVRGELPEKPTRDPHRSPGSPRSPGSVKPAALGGAMFGNFANAKNRKAPPWAAPLLSAVVVFHVVLFASMWVKSIWDIELLERPKTQVDLAVAPPPPPPPPPPPGGAKPVTPQITPKKIKVKDLVQPVKTEKQEVAKVEDSGDPNGVEGGEEGGVAGGVVGGDPNGVMGAPPPSPPPPPPAPPQNVPPTLLEGSRVAGEKMIVPDDVTKTEIQRSGKDKIIGSFKLCINAGGEVTAVTMLKSTTFPAYDNKIQGKMRGEWRYRPYAVNGKAVPVCTAVTFIYSQK